MIISYVNHFAGSSQSFLSWLHVFVCDKSIPTWFPSCFINDYSSLVNFTMQLKCLHKQRNDNSSSRTLICIFSGKTMMQKNWSVSNVIGHLVMKNYITGNDCWGNQQFACDNALTAHKVSEVVFQAKPRTKSFRRAGSALATLLISSAIKGYWDPLQATTCKQAHTHNVNSHSMRLSVGKQCVPTLAESRLNI